MIRYLNIASLASRKVIMTFTILFYILIFQNLSAGTVRGVVIDVRTTDPLNNVVIMVVDTTNNIRATSMTDSSGVFLITEVKQKKFFIKSYRLGYVNITAGPYNLTGDDTLNMTIKLEALPFMLDEAVITGKKVDPYLDEVDFYKRKKLGMGHYITSDDFKGRTLPNAYDIFRGIPGLIVENDKVYFSRYSSSSLNATAVQPLIYIDGTLLVDTNYNLGWLNPEIVSGVEIYDGIKAPVQYGRGNIGGVILIWTKH